jgi:hypothetical protein
MAIGWIVFAPVFGSALLAMFVRSALPEHHLSADSKDVVKLGIALVATMSALVLSLLIASAKSAFDTRSNQLVQASADVILLNSVLARYRPETKEARAVLRRWVADTVERFWPAEGTRPIAIDPKASPAKAVYDKIEELSPQSDAQRSLRSQALTMALDVGRTRVLLFEHLGTSISRAVSGGVGVLAMHHLRQLRPFAPRNATVITVLGVCALSVSGAIFLILELDRSFKGLLQVSGAPLRAALAQLGQ